ncbi:unnamed protein product [Lepidochelys olivacea]
MLLDVIWTAVWSTYCKHAGKEALILDDNNGVSFCLESDVDGNPVNFSGWPIECEAGRGQSRIWECHSSRKGRPCVDCHAFEFMQRALQDLKKTAYNLDTREQKPSS